MTRADPKYHHVGIYLQTIAGAMLFLALLVHIGDRAQVRVCGRGGWREMSVKIK